MNNKNSSPTRSAKIDPARVQRNVTAVINDGSLSLEELKQLSPVPIPAFGPAQTIKLFEHLYAKDENIYVTKKGTKWIRGVETETIVPGACASRDELMKILGTDHWERAPRGYLFAINPVSPNPSGKCGVVRDADCQKWRYVLAECDELSLPRQAALLAHLPLPIKSIVHSGGRSLHALVEVNAENEVEYRKLARGLLQKLKLLGFDHTCSNPSRMSRLPGFTRFDEKAGQEKLQELLYLCVIPKPEAIL